MTKKKTDAQQQEPQATPVESAAVEDIQFEQPLVEIEAIEKLKKELAESQSKAEEYLDGWQRSRAEFANYKKRIERDQNETYLRAAGSIVKRYLEVVDDLELALKNRPQEGDGVPWSNGIELIYRKLINILDSEGVKPMQVQGQPFDPNLHEAISLEPSDTVPSGHVTEVLKQGYLLGEKVLRPALVRVAG
jgi:molecular chaperone GrpE